MPTVEDYFDDDTDLPLPGSSSSAAAGSSRRGLGGEGLHGHLLEEITSEDEVDTDMMDFSKLADQSRGEYGADSKAPPPQFDNGKGKLVARDQDDGIARPAAGGQGGPGMMNPNTPMGGFMGDMMKLQQAEEDRIAKLRQQFGNTAISRDPSVYKAWNSVYPLYFDAKVSINDGRRVPRQSALWWPLATHIAQACSSLGLPSVYEPEKTHPADWENPGRVKVQFIKDGQYLNPIVKNRTQLYNQLARQMQNANPSLIPEPINAASKSAKKAKAAAAASAASGKKSSTSTKQSKSKAGKAKASTNASKTAPAAVVRRLPTQTPQPPQPVPVLDDRLPLHSPRVATGVAVSSVKRDIESEKEAKKKGITAGTGGEGEEGGKDKQPKMKRIVVRGKR